VTGLFVMLVLRGSAAVLVAIATTLRTLFVIRRAIQLPRCRLLRSEWAVGIHILIGRQIVLGYV
jgi:hypothetical protein